jgi:GTP-binding protein EngB required for normal cell division
MVTAPDALRNDLLLIREVLSGRPVALNEQEAALLLEDADRLLEKLDALSESHLTVGLVGGTGVGKSSFMNALARSRIASTSHRRPHTERILIYHHESAPLPPALLSSSLPWHEVKHTASAVQQLLLCDLPDFDSLMGNHRERVVAFLDHLDVVVWVTSPEKYADEQFYSFLQEVPKSKHNFYFVVNKVDLLFADDSPTDGYERLGALTALFQKYLRNHGIPEPVIYAVSVKELESPQGCSPWNQLWNLRNEIFRLRDSKEVMNIKTANVDVEVEKCVHAMQREVQGLLQLHDVLRLFVDELERKKSAWRGVGKRAFSALLEMVGRGNFMLSPPQKIPLVGVGGVIGNLSRDWKRLVAGSAGDEGLLEALSAGVPLQILERELESVEHRLIHQALQGGLAGGGVSYLKGVVDVAQEKEALPALLYQTIGASLEACRFPPLKLFRWVQPVVYAGILLLFLLALSDMNSWQGFLGQPSWGGFALLLFLTVMNLFHPSGLAALGSFLLLNTLAGWWFFKRYRKLLQRHQQKFIESLQLQLEALWDQVLDTIIGRLRESLGILAQKASGMPVLKRNP